MANANTTSPAYTPAPWETDIQPEYIIIVGADGTRIADVYAAPDTDTDTEAVACGYLIAAAPSLRTASQRLYDAINGYLKNVDTCAVPSELQEAMDELEAVWRQANGTQADAA